jgi:uncharacterized protein (TIGR03086 family)
MQDPIAMLQRTVDAANALVGSVQPGELTQPTPCEAWDVRALLNHMVVGNQMIAGVLGGTPPAIDPTRPPPDVVGSDPAGAYSAAAAAALAGWRAPGVLQRTLTMPWGPTPAGIVIGFHLLDQAAHSWDLAKALGRGGPLDADLAEAALAFARQSVRPEMRGPKSPIGTEVPCPADAPAQDRLAAFLGRQP